MTLLIILRIGALDSACRAFIHNTRNRNKKNPKAFFQIKFQYTFHFDKFQSHIIRPNRNEIKIKWKLVWNTCIQHLLNFWYFCIMIIRQGIFNWKNSIKMKLLSFNLFLLWGNFYQWIIPSNHKVSLQITSVMIQNVSPVSTPWNQ
jgi:hypothetical protein